MKTLFNLIVLIVLVVVARARLPEGKPNADTVLWSENCTAATRTLVSAGMALSPCGIEDYGVVKIATFRPLNLTLIGEPITGRWHRVASHDN